MSKELPWMKYSPRDFYGDPMVQSMSDDQELIYHRLIAVSWEMGPLPSSTEKLSSLARMTIERFTAAWTWPLSEKWTNNGKGLINHRIEDEREGAMARSSQARRGADEKHKRRTARILLQQSSSTTPAQLEHCSSPAILDIDLDIEKEKEEEKSVPRTRIARLVHWDPKPRWKKDHPSLKDAVLRVDPGHLRSLASDFPRVEGNGGGVQAEVLKMKRHALSDPSWARKKRDWGKTLTNWLKNADERFDDARFKANSRASPTADIIAWEAAKEVGRDRAAETAESIARCEKENGPHVTAKLTKGSKTLYCDCGCGYYEVRK